jgi:hypothetical protein
LVWPDEPETDDRADVTRAEHRGFGVGPRGRPAWQAHDTRNQWAQGLIAATAGDWPRQLLGFEEEPDGRFDV